MRRISPDAKVTSSENDVEIVMGTVENVNDAPPFTTVSDDVATVAPTEKSDAIPVVAPEAPDTLIVHTTGRPMRDGLVLVQERLEPAVGLP